MSPSVRFVLRDRGLIREKIVKKVESSMKTGKRTSVVNREKMLVLEGDILLPVGRTS